MRTLTTLLLVAALAACDSASGPAEPERPSTDGPADTPRSTEANASPAGGHLDLGQASIDIPAGAVEMEQQITLRVTSPPQPLPGGTLAAGAVYEIAPHGLAFAVPITVRLPFEGETDPTLDLLRLSGPDDTSWDDAVAATFGDNLATFELSSLSYYVVVRRCPELEDTLEPALVRTAGCGARECGLWIPGTPACGSCGTCRTGASCSDDGICLPDDAGAPDAGSLHAAAADASTFDASVPDAGPPDASTPDAATSDAGPGDASTPPEPTASFALVAGNPGTGGRFDIEDLDGDPSTHDARIMMAQGVSHYPADGSFYFMGFQTIAKYTPDDGNFEFVAGHPYPQPSGYVDGDPSVSELSQSAGNLILGDHLYFSDNGPFNIRRMYLPTHVIETFVGPTGGEGPGFADGTGTAARFRFRDNSAYEANLTTDGDFLYVADSDNHAIRRVDLGTLPGGTAGEVITIAGGLPPTQQSGYVDGTGTDARFHYPYSIAYEPTSNVLIVGDGCNQRTRRIALPADPRSPTYLDQVTVSTHSGDGVQRVVDGLGTAASHPNCSMRSGALIVDGNFVVAEGGLIREVELASGQVTTVIGPYPDSSLTGQLDGIGLDVRLLGPGGSFAYDGSHVYFPDFYTLRRYDPATYEVETLIGPDEDWNLKTDGPVGTSRFGANVAPVRDTGDPSALLLVEGGAGLRHLDLQTDTLTTLSGPAATDFGYVDGTGAQARVGTGIGSAVQVGPDIYFTDVYNCAIRVITPDLQNPANTVTRTVVGAPPPTADCRTLEGFGTEARINQPWGLVHDQGVLYVGSSNGRVVYSLDLASLELRVLAGSGASEVADGVGAAASFARPWALAMAHDGKLYVSDVGSAVIRRLDPLTGEVVTVAGDYPGLEWGHQDGVGSDARLENAFELQASSDGRLLYFIEASSLRTLDVDTLEVSTLFYATAEDPIQVDAPTPFSTRLRFRALAAEDPKSFLIFQASHEHLLRLTLP